jgi:predicted MPP superfamily phosphohydrolase
VAVGLVAFALAIWAFWWEPKRLVSREARLTLPCWNVRPLRIAVVSDLHIGSPFTGIEKLDQIVAEINAGRPDVIVLLGDFVIQGVTGGKFVPPEATAARLANLHAPLGVFAVLGNHDWWLDAQRVSRSLRSASIEVIDDRAVRLEHGGPFWLVGVSDFQEGPHDVAGALRQVTDSAPVLVITHNPDVFPLIPNRVCLTLAGHTHGGQVALPIVGRLIVPSRYGQRYAIGHIRENGKDLFVTSGVGTSIIPARFRVPPEIVFLEITQRALRSSNTKPRAGGFAIRFFACLRASRT